MNGSGALAVVVVWSYPLSFKAKRENCFLLFLFIQPNQLSCKRTGGWCNDVCCPGLKANCGIPFPLVVALGYIVFYGFLLIILSFLSLFVILAFLFNLFFIGRNTKNSFWGYFYFCFLRRTKKQLISRSGSPAFSSCCS